MDYSINRHPEFRYKTEFQSHEPEVFFSQKSLMHHHRMYLCLLSVLNCLYSYCAYSFSQFDYLKSLEIEEKINKIRWCQTANGALFLLSTNDKTIKFWKVGKQNLLVAVSNLFHIVALTTHPVSLLTCILYNSCNYSSWSFF